MINAAGSYYRPPGCRRITSAGPLRHSVLVFPSGWRWHGNLRVAGLARGSVTRASAHPSVLESYSTTSIAVEWFPRALDPSGAADSVQCSFRERGGRGELHLSAAPGCRWRPELRLLSLRMPARTNAREMRRRRNGDQARMVTVSLGGKRLSGSILRDCPGDPLDRPRFFRLDCPDLTLLR